MLIKSIDTFPCCLRPRQKCYIYAFRYILIKTFFKVRKKILYYIKPKLTSKNWFLTGSKFWRAIRFKILDNKTHNLCGISSDGKGFRRISEIRLSVYIFWWNFICPCSLMCLVILPKKFFDLAPFSDKTKGLKSLFYHD